MSAPTVIVRATADVGEGPFWNNEKGVVHWVDIPSGHIMTTAYPAGETETFHHHEMVGAAIPRTGGGMAAAVQSGFVGFDDNWAVTHTVPLLTEGYRMNDAATDSSGRMWAGSNTLNFVAGEGKLWRLDHDWSATLVHTGLTLPNGIGWSPDDTTMYLVDSMQKIVFQFPFDPAEAAISGKPTIFVHPDSFEGLPDGLAVDTRGHVWIAEFGASQVTEFSPDGVTVSRITIPTKQPTSLAFVGPARDRLWVTSAASGLNPATDPLAGSVFEIADTPAPGLMVQPFGG